MRPDLAWQFLVLALLRSKQLRSLSSQQCYNFAVSARFRNLSMTEQTMFRIRIVVEDIMCIRRFGVMH